MVFADLHVHTDASDGTLSLPALPAAARRSGLGAVAVTDHDRLHPGLSAPVTERAGVEVVAGIELRVEAADQRVDLLGYAVDPTDALEAELDRLQRDRVERGRAIADCVADRLGVSLDVDFEAGVGRPHIARAVVAHPDTAYDRIGQVFADLIGEHDPCFVARDVTDFETGAALLRESSAIVGLAHPFRYPDPEGALALCEHLDAVEAYYPYDGDRGRAESTDTASALLSSAIEAHDLLETGGSDAHGTDLGDAGLSRAQYERVAAHLPRP